MVKAAASSVIGESLHAEVNHVGIPHGPIAQPGEDEAGIDPHESASRSYGLVSLVGDDPRVVGVTVSWLGFMSVPPMIGPSRTVASTSTQIRPRRTLPRLPSRFTLGYHGFHSPLRPEKRLTRNRQMAKKKRKPPKRSQNRAIRSRPKSYSPPELPDRRAMEGVMKGFLGEMLGGPAAGTPLDKAQQLMYQAFGTPDPEERAKLAKQALELCPDCADAYVLLAEQTKSRKEALDLFEKGVAAGERALGPKAFQEEVGHFWSLLETRPYMRAREGLASKLWTMGRRDEVIKHLQDMLRLNPGDNQGVRYTLAGWLLAEGRDGVLARLLKEYDEGSANWACTKALVAFRQNGDTPETRKLLKVAQKANTHVPAYLLGRKPLPQERPSYYSPGDQNEAVFYVGTALSGWKETPGATAWLKEVEQGTRTKRTEQPKALGPTPLVKKRLQRLPQVFDVWQADFRPLPSWIEEKGERYQSWIVMVTSRTDDLILTQEMTGEPPSSALIWDTLAVAMERPASGDPHRPVELHVPPNGAGMS